MAILICTTCDRPFDTDEQVEAEYLPLPKCEECVRDSHEQDKQAWWLQQNDDDNWIRRQLDAG